jgi:hypothetical protein
MQPGPAPTFVVGTGPGVVLTVVQRECYGISGDGDVVPVLFRKGFRR